MNVPIPQIRIELDVGNLEAMHAAPVQDVMQAFEKASMLSAEFARGLWVRVAQMMKIRHTGDYIAGIQSRGRVEVVERRIGERTAEIVIAITNTSEHASIVEDGHAAFSLVHAINWGRTDGRIKRTKDGRPYLHIPFRHSAYVGGAEREAQGTTYGALRAMMPEHVYAEAKRLQHTTAHRVGPIRGPGGQHLAADRYSWGGRLDRSHTSPAIIAGGPGVSAGGRGEVAYEEHRGARMVGRDQSGNPLVNPAWKSSKFHGLFRSGSPGHSQYMTIRVITPDSQGWNIPAQAGYGVARRVASNLASGAGARRLNEIVGRAMYDALGGGQ